MEFYSTSCQSVRIIFCNPLSFFPNSLSSNCTRLICVESSYKLRRGSGLLRVTCGEPFRPPQDRRPSESNHPIACIYRIVISNVWTDPVKIHVHLLSRTALSILMLIAKLPSPEVAVQMDEPNNAHIDSGCAIFRRAMQSRTMVKNVLHLAPILDSLPASAVVLEASCGPGGITLEFCGTLPTSGGFWKRH